MINKLNKKMIRKSILEMRRMLSSDAILDKSNKIANYLIKFDKYQQSENIMLYISTKSEVQTQKIINSAQSDNKNIFIPLIIKEKHDLLPSLIKNFQQELQIGDLGVYEPKINFQRVHPPEILDLVIIPGVAFTRQGYRLGRGGGYYDRFLSKLVQKTCKIALSFDFQIIEKIPVEKHDIAVDYIITEKGIINTSEY
ncbi:MAG: 5-formyltetrahydrofolate cyclo-ligase [Atribacterota bacterium]|nr:5-formyltetrahydrofolate cyclo-ligase [Atribacterota bacterium]